LFGQHANRQQRYPCQDLQVDDRQRQGGINGSRYGISGRVSFEKTALDRHAVARIAIRVRPGTTRVRTIDTIIPHRAERGRNKRSIEREGSEPKHPDEEFNGEDGPVVVQLLVRDAIGDEPVSDEDAGCYAGEDRDRSGLSRLDEMRR